MSHDATGTPACAAPAAISAARNAAAASRSRGSNTASVVPQAVITTGWLSALYRTSASSGASLSQGTPASARGSHIVAHAAAITGSA